jgi:hypothetical protein
VKGGGGGDHEQKKRVLVSLVSVAIFPYVLLVGLLCLIRAIRLHRHKTLIVNGMMGMAELAPRVPFDVRIENYQGRYCNYVSRLKWIKKTDLIEPIYCSVKQGADWARKCQWQVSSQSKGSVEWLAQPRCGKAAR